MLPLMHQTPSIHRWLQLPTLVWAACASFALAAQLDAKTTVPAPIVVPSSNDWEGNDGPWSSFTIEIGTPAQSINVLVSTASYQTWGVDPAGCTSNDPSDCATLRGRFYNNSASTSWDPNTSNITTTIYDLDLESDLGYSGKGRYGYDNITLGYLGSGGPTLANQTVASIATKDFYMGVFGLKPQASNFTSLTDPIPSFLQNLRTQSIIPSLSWAYTAGNQYRLNGVYGSLVLGGYDASKFKPNNLTFDFGPEDNRELLLELNEIKTEKGASLLPEPISMYLDSTVPYIYLPEAACAMFESTFGLVWDNATQLYLLTDAQHTTLQAQDPSITFTVGNLTSSATVDITLPYSAFDLTVSYPIVENATRYFPLKRANDSSQYALGRAFFQEAYVIADYERRSFSVSECNWDASLSQEIVTIFPPSNSTQDTTRTKSHHSLPLAAITAGSAGVVILLIIALILLSILHRRKKAKGQKLTESTPTTAPNINPEAELDAHSPEHKADLHEFSGSLKFPSEMLGNEILEIDPYGRKWPPSPNAVEADSLVKQEVYEMDAGEVAIEMSGVGNGRRRSRGGRPMSFVEGDDWSPDALLSPRSADGRFGFGGADGRFMGVERWREGVEVVSPVSAGGVGSPASEGFSPRDEKIGFL